MISRWLICSRSPQNGAWVAARRAAAVARCPWPRPALCGLLAPLLGVLAAHANGATVTGKVELRDSREAAVSKKMDYSGVVVWLEPVGPASGKAAPSPNPAPAAMRARMIQKEKTFTPHVLGIPVGATVEFPNFDPIFHNAFSNYNGKTFDLGLYAPGTSKSVVFSKPGVVRVFCNIHANMSAVIVVLDTPYFDVSKRAGTFEINGVPQGDYRLHVFHERATQITLNALDRRVAVAADSVTLPPIAISESGYLPIPHNNKYGHEYMPEPDDNGVYPAVRK
jgi:plastocyanin